MVPGLLILKSARLNHLLMKRGSTPHHWCIMFDILRIFSRKKRTSSSSMFFCHVGEKPSLKVKINVVSNRIYQVIPWFLHGVNPECCHFFRCVVPNDYYKYKATHGKSAYRTKVLTCPSTCTRCDLTVNNSTIAYNCFIFMLIHMSWYVFICQQNQPHVGDWWIDVNVNRQWPVPCQPRHMFSTV